MVTPLLYFPESICKAATRWALDLYPLDVDGTPKVENYLKLGGGMLMMPSGLPNALYTAVSLNLGQVDRETALREMERCMFIPNPLKQPLIGAKHN